MRPAHLLTVIEKEYASTREGHHTPVMLWGPPGVGKSQMVAQIANRHDAPLIDIRLSQMEPSDLRGIPFRAEKAVEWAVPAMLPDAQRHGEEGILFLDEITSAPPSVSAAAYQLILDRKLGEYEGQFRLRGGLLIPAVALLVSTWLLTHAAPESWLVTGVFMLLGGLLYVLKKRPEKAPRRDAKP